jgi:methionine-gamma-lyase
VVHAGRSLWTPAAGESSHVPPLYQTSNFDYPSARAADAAASGRAYLYTRDGNPTCDAMAAAIADLDGAEAGLAFASGMAALTTAVLGLCAPGDHIVASAGLYGGTTRALRELEARCGIALSLVPAWQSDAVATALRPNTRLVVVETMTNPLLRVADLPALAALARARGVNLLVDSTFTTPVLCRPIEHGASLVMHSVTKYLAGHSDVVAGVVVGERALVDRLLSVRGFAGGVLDPFAAWLALRGLRTLALRMERQSENAARIAAALAELRGIAKVHYPGLASHPDHALAARLFAAPGAMVSFDVGDGEAARRVYDRVQVIARAASLGEVESLLTHPASFSHRALSPEERAQLGITDGLLRLSVGIEDWEDVVADVAQALAG